ncbi:MAG: flagellar hook assembly protein FlgD [Pseudomonadales bacterium]
MDLGGIRSANDLGAAAGAAATAGREELGKNQFLELMIAQFNNQDPLEPAKNEDFIAQLAQFSSLEGIQNLNATVESMAAALRSSTTLQAASMVGRSVVAPAGQALMEGQGLGGNVVNDQGTADIVVEITDAGGALVQRLELGPHAEGDVRFRWDGENAAGEPQSAGIYGFRAYALREGEPTQLEVELPERVASVSFDGGEARLNLAGGASVRLSEIRELQ